MPKLTGLVGRYVKVVMRDHPCTKGKEDFIGKMLTDRAEVLGDDMNSLVNKCITILKDDGTMVDVHTEYCDVTVVPEPIPRKKTLLEVTCEALKFLPQGTGGLSDTPAYREGLLRRLGRRD